MRAFVFTFCALALVSCGGGGVEVSPTAPATPAPTPPPLTGAVVTFVSGETRDPVAGARVEVGGATYTTDAWGRVGLQALGLTTVTTGGYLTRRLDLAAEGAQTLWPLSRQTTELWVEYLAYRVDSDRPRRPMRRLPAGEAWLVYNGDDAGVQSAAEAAAREATKATGGVVQLRVVREAGAGPAIRLVVAPEEFLYPAGIIAYASMSWSAAGWITGGELVFRGLEDGRRLHTVLHELGHGMGLGHPVSSAEYVLPTVMTTGGGTATKYSPPEELVIGMMYQRSAGNVFPDDAPGLVLAGQASGRIEIACP